MGTAAVYVSLYNKFRFNFLNNHQTSPNL